MNNKLALLRYFVVMSFQTSWADFTGFRRKTLDAHGRRKGPSDGVKIVWTKSENGPCER